VELREEFRRFKAFALDCDGTLWLGGKPIPSALEAVRALRREGKLIVYVTNNATLSRRAYVRKLRCMGFEAGLKDVFCSSYVTAKYLEGRISTAFVVGEVGLVEELALRGIEVAGPEEDAVDCVVVGLDRGLTYWKLAVAARYLRSGSLFVATNRDSTLPSPEGLVPGAGSVVAALEVASGRRVDVEIGKPSPLIFKAVLDELKLSESEVLVVGDRLDTDVEGARRAGLSSALVLTGVAGGRGVGGGPEPDYVFKTLLDIFE